MSCSIIKIPERILVPNLRNATQKNGKCCDNFTTLEFETLRFNCGPEFAGVPLDDIRRQSINLRKRGILGAISGHSAAKSEPPTAEMLAYYATDHWKVFAAAIREFWGHRCALCNSDERLDVHHRTYERLGQELETDCVALCRKCHKVADVRRKVQRQRPVQPKMF